MPISSKKQRPGVWKRRGLFCLLGGLALAAAGCYFLMNSDLLFMAGGQVIEAEASWTIEDRTFYETAGGVFSVEAGAVAFRSEAFRLSREDVQRRAVYYGEAVLRRWEQLSDLALSGHAPPSGVLLLAGGALIVVAGAVLRVRSRKRKALSAGAALPETGENSPGVSVSPRLVGLKDIVRFFFQIYRLQLKAPAEAPGKIEPLTPEPGNRSRRFRLGVRIENGWKWRYMTVRPIGEAAGSKSQCFYVIYDTHIVVKIPPVPIRGFSDYIRRIKFESEIVRTLNPRKCIIPNVSVILSKIRRFDDAHLRSDEQLEDDYVRLLERSPQLHQCLKIEDDFAFFMDLSRDYFLSHAMAGPAGENLAAVMAEDAPLIADCRGFEARFGAENGWICLELQNLYRRFSEGLLRRLADTDAVGRHQMQEWFCRRLVDSSAPLDGATDAAGQEADKLLGRLLQKEAASVEAYRGMARPHARRVSFHRTRPMKEALSSNLLDLLSWLERRRVAIRDLKPDNLLVSGDPSRYPIFLASAEEFAIGLIDLETAVACPADASIPPKQPQLGGTPSYATPSHFLPNRVLEQIYTDLWTVFFLQDAHAIIGIIFQVVTGKQLFRRSSGLFPALIRALQTSADGRQSMAAVYPRHNTAFWRAARKEFSDNAARCRSVLDAVFSSVPEPVRSRLFAAIDRQRSELARQIREAVDAQELIRDEKRRSDLCACSKRAVVGAMEKAKRSGGARADGFCRFFENLAELKDRQERLASLHQSVSSGRTRMTISDLLAAMFEQVSCEMAGEEQACAAGAEAEPALDEPVAGEERDATLGYTHTACL